MKYTPHKYQEYASTFIKEHPISAIFLSCGMGKTSIALSAISDLMYDEYEVNKVLIIGPLRISRITWADEIKKWDEFSFLRYSIAVGSAKERLAALKADADIYIINRENLPWLVEKSGIPFDFDMVVIDELSSFKNHQAKRFKALMKVRPQVKRIVGLTGTPTGSGGYMDLFAEFKCLDMGERLGRFIGRYREAYFMPGATNGQIVFNYVLLPGAEEAINERISDITISMEAVDHLDMPELISTEYPVYMDAKEKSIYAEMKRDLVVNTAEGEVTAANAAALSGKLTQMSNGAVYVDDDSVAHIHDRKLDALEDIIEAAVGNPVLVVYWYKHDRERIMERLSALKIPHKCIDTDESIREWNDGKLPVALCHPASAGHGLNLQESGSNTMVFFGIPWSLELYQQTVARLWRQGQRNRTVSVIHIITKGTIDERIMKALSEKDMTQKSLIEAVKAQF